MSLPTRARWRAKLFFRWIKQHLHTRAVYSTSQNAAKTQVWAAITVHVLVAILKRQHRLDLSLFKILQILSVTIFEKPAVSLGGCQFDDILPQLAPSNQPPVFNL